MNFLFSSLASSLSRQPAVPEVYGIAGQYYAYYLPGDLLHLTSLQAIPVYAACVYFGLHILDRIEQLPRRKEIPVGLFAAGILYLLTG